MNDMKKKSNDTNANIDYIRKNIKLIRESKNLAQREVSQAIGIITNTYQKFENGDIVLNMIRLHQIAEVFGMSVADIINYPNVVVAGADSERVKELEIRNHNLERLVYAINHKYKNSRVALLKSNVTNLRLRKKLGEEIPNQDKLIEEFENGLNLLQNDDDDDIDNIEQLMKAYLPKWSSGTE